MSLLKKYLSWRQGRINNHNRLRLKNLTPTLICSNCTGGVLYHWLGLEFRSPFINLYLDNEDFLTAMENFDEFISGGIEEVKNSGKNYPVGKGIHGEIIHFMHYPDFKTALSKWQDRCSRINKNNMIVMLSNFGIMKNRCTASVRGGANLL